MAGHMLLCEQGLSPGGRCKGSLGAALASIRKKGGGMVEAYPANHKRAVGN